MGYVNAKNTLNIWFYEPAPIVNITAAIWKHVMIKNTEQIYNFLSLYFCFRGVDSLPKKLYRFYSINIFSIIIYFYSINSYIIRYFSSPTIACFFNLIYLDSKIQSSQQYNNMSGLSVQKVESDNSGKQPSSQRNILTTQMIIVPNRIQLKRQKQKNDWNDSDDNKKSDVIDKRFWKKLRMIKVYQNCRVCNKSIHILNGIHPSFPGSFDPKIQEKYNDNNWAVLLLQETKTKIIENKKGKVTKQTEFQSLNKKQQPKTKDQAISNYMNWKQSLKQLKKLSEYYKYYQYIPLSPLMCRSSVKNSDKKAFALLHNFLNKKITIFYNKVKKMLVHKQGQDSLQIFNSNQVVRESQQPSNSVQLLSCEKSRSLFHESGLSSQSVRDLLCQIGDSTNFIKSSDKSSFRQNNQKNLNILRNQYFSSVDHHAVLNQLGQKRSCNSNKFSDKKSVKKYKKNNKQSWSKLKEKKRLKHRTRSIEKLETESQQDLRKNQDKKMRMSTKISTKKLKKKKGRNSCDNLAGNTINQKKKINPIKISLNASDRNFSNMIQAPLFEQKKIRNYIVNLKRKINIDKQKLRESAGKNSKNDSFHWGDNKVGETIQIKNKKQGESKLNNRRQQSFLKQSQQLFNEDINDGKLIFSNEKEMEIFFENLAKKSTTKKDLLKKQKKEENSMSPVTKVKGKQSRKKNNTKLREKQVRKKGVMKNRGQKIKSTGRGNEKKNQLSKNKQKEGKSKEKRRRMERIDKSNIFNTRIHSSITTEMDF